MAWNFYAVRKGKTTGVVSSWAECQEMVKGVSGAEFKGFNSEPEAQAYLVGEDTVMSAGVVVQRPADAVSANIYARGTFIDRNIDIGIIIETNVKTFRFYGRLICHDWHNARGFAGELVGTMVAAQLCNDMGILDMNIVFSYDGVEKWPSGTWAAHGGLSNAYSMALYRLRLSSGVSYQYTKVDKKRPPAIMNDVQKMVARNKIDVKYIDLDKVLQGTLVAKDVPLYSIT